MVVGGSVSVAAYPMNIIIQKYIEALRATSAETILLLRPVTTMIVEMVVATGSGAHIAGHGSIVGTSGRTGKPLKWESELVPENGRGVSCLIWLGK